VVDESNTDRTHLCQLLAELGDRRPKSLYLKAAGYEFLVTIRRRFPV
jgi:hypothetical protein